MKKLRNKSLRASILLVLILFIIGAVLLYNSVPPLLIYARGTTPLEEVDFSGDIENLYVEGTLPFIYDWYCETTEGVETVSREYIIDGGDLYYMGMLVMAKDMDAAEALMEASQDYMDGLADYTDVYEAQYAIKGTIVKMPDDSVEFYHEYVEWDSMTADEQEMFLPYYINVGKVGDSTLSGAIGIAVVGLIMLGLGLFFLIRALSGKEQKMVYAYINSCPDPEAAKEKVESFLENTPEINKLRYNHEFICGTTNGGRTVFGETQKLVWAYQHTTTHKRNFVTVGKTYCVMLVFADGSRQEARVPSEAAAQEHLQKLAELCPRAILGYSSELDGLFRKDFNGLLALKYNRPDEYAPPAYDPNPTQPAE